MVQMAGLASREVRSVETTRTHTMMMKTTTLLLNIFLPCCMARMVHVYTTVPSSHEGVARKQQFDLQQLANVQAHFYSREEQADLVRSSCPELKASYDKSNDAVRDELFKWCILANPNHDSEITAVLDSSSPIISLSSLWSVMEKKGNVAVLDEQNKMIHGSYIQMDRSSTLPQKMLAWLTTVDAVDLNRRTTLLPKTTYEKMNSDAFEFLSLSCETPSTYRFECAKDQGYCCSIQDHSLKQTLLFNRFYVHPPRILDASIQRPFSSTVAAKTFPKSPEAPKTPNLYEILKEKHCLPDNDKCYLCLREKKGATCKTCASHCGCFCKSLCNTEVPKKHVAERWTVSPPPYELEPDRMIPRIVHQTWYEELKPSKYPNMSRMVESFRQSGWEYRFYTDDTAESFLKEHFPPPVLQAYRVLKPGAFKADLFRYCVLLIHGGVYADVDIQLESALDISIPPDAAFVVPVDEPGRPVGKQMCLWNGFIASVPAHPFLATAIETIVNQVRNRFTSIDIDADFCPNPELSVLHAYDTLFTAGPCLLGASMNRVMNRHLQQSHVPGSSNHEHGRTIILHQNKWDMGAHRFTNLDQNLVVAATDLPDGDDLAEESHHQHYSKAHAKSGIYGLEHLYDPDFVAVDEEIRIELLK